MSIKGLVEVGVTVVVGAGRGEDRGEGGCHLVRGKREYEGGAIQRRELRIA